MSCNWHGICLRGIKIPQNVLEKYEREARLISATIGRQHTHAQDLMKEAIERTEAEIKYVHGYETGEPDEFSTGDVFLTMHSVEVYRCDPAEVVDFPELSSGEEYHLRLACKALGFQYEPPKLYVGCFYI